MIFDFHVYSVQATNQKRCSIESEENGKETPTYGKYSIKSYITPFWKGYITILIAYSFSYANELDWRNGNFKRYMCLAHVRETEKKNRHISKLFGSLTLI